MTKEREIEKTVERAVERLAESHKGDIPGVQGLQQLQVLVAGVPTDLQVLVAGVATDLEVLVTPP